MKDKCFKLNGHQFKITPLESESYSVTCLDPSIDQDGTDHTLWPTDGVISTEVGVAVSFFDTGDDSDYPEAIYHTA